LMNYSEHYFGFASGTHGCTIMGRRRPNRLRAESGSGIALAVLA